MEVVVGTSVIPPRTVVVVVDEVVVAVVVDVAAGADVCGVVSSVVPGSRGRVVVVVARGATVVTGTRTAGTSWVGGAGSGRTQR